MAFFAQTTDSPIEAQPSAFDLAIWRELQLETFCLHQHQEEQWLGPTLLSPLV